MEMAQLEIVVSKETAERFKRIVLAKHGWLELNSEGEEALKLYIKKYEHLSRESSSRDDPLREIIGIGRSSGKADVLKDSEKLEKSHERKNS
jgi:hypothetical protein